ncbi:MAG: hypothetical protein NUV57_03600 [archaeon]|nr:hypothetical protein [archaeon]
MPRTHAEFRKNTLAKGIQLGNSGREYREMGLTRQQALLIEIDRLHQREARIKLPPGRQRRSLDLLRSIAQRNIEQIYK